MVRSRQTQSNVLTFVILKTVYPVYRAVQLLTDVP